MEKKSYLRNFQESLSRRILYGSLHIFMLLYSLYSKTLSSLSFGFFVCFICFYKAKSCCVFWAILEFMILLPQQDEEDSHVITRTFLLSISHFSFHYIVFPHDQQHGYRCSSLTSSLPSPSFPVDPVMWCSL
jgi:hypothetical protein